MREHEDARPIATVWAGVSDLKIELRWSSERQRGRDSVIVALPSSQSHQCARFGVLPTTNLHITMSLIVRVGSTSRSSKVVACTAGLL